MDDEKLAKLERLAALMERGLLTDEEYSAQKRAILQQSEDKKGGGSPPSGSHPGGPHDSRSPDASVAREPAGARSEPVQKKKGGRKWWVVGPVVAAIGIGFVVVLVVAGAGMGLFWWKERRDTRREAIRERVSEVVSGRADAEREAQQSDQRRAQAESARREAERRRVEEAKLAAPSKVLVGTVGCTCTQGKQIVVTCSVVNNSEFKMWTFVNAKSATGTMGVRSSGGEGHTLTPHSKETFLVATHFDGLMDCSSCGASQCELTGTALDEHMFPN